MGEDPEKGASHLRSLWLWGTKTDVKAHREFSLPVSTPPKGDWKGRQGAVLHRISFQVAAISAKAVLKFT